MMLGVTGRPRWLGRPPRGGGIKSRIDKYITIYHCSLPCQGKKMSSVKNNNIYETSMGARLQCLGPGKLYNC